MTLTRAATARRLPTRRVRRAVAGALVVALTTSLGLVGAQAHAPVDGSSGAGDPYWPLDGNGGIDVQSYRIDNTWSFRKQKLRGSTTLELRATQDLSSFSLDFLLPVSSVSVDGVPAAFSTSQKHELRIRPTTPLATDSVHRVRVDYAGVPRQYAYAGERAMIWGPKEVVAMGEPHMSPWWFPANDHPSDKALMDISVTVPAGREAIANGHLVSTRKTKKSTTWRWRADEPMTTYLAFFAAGDFAIRKGTSEGLPWLVAVSRQLPKPSRKASMKLMLRTPAIVRWLEGSLGDYPFSVTGGLTTSLFTGFALENQTRPTYPAVGSQATSLVVHELAHQWFGDDVAVAQWRDIWLNEGFASFMEWYWAESRGEQSGAVQLQRSLRDNPATSDFWKVTIGDPGAERIFDGAVYERGAMTLQALRTRIGNDEVFFRLLRTWSERKSGGNATSAEFEALAAEVTGLDLTAFFTAWLRTGSRPAATADNGLA